MQLSKKSDENLKVVGHCISRNSYLNAVVGRLYYSVFQKIKYILIRDGFDYDQFRIMISKQDEKNFSHGTIKRAFIEYCQQKRYPRQDYVEIQNIDQLYNARRKADYDEVYMVNKFEVEKLYEVTDKIIDAIDCLDN